MIDSPSGRSLEKAPRWDLMGTEGCGSGKVVSWLSLINLVGQTKLIIRRDLQRYCNHAYKNSEKNQILFIDNLDHKPTIHRISTNTPQKELHRIDLQEDRGEFVLRSKEREEDI